MYRLPSPRYAWRTACKAVLDHVKYFAAETMPLLSALMTMSVVAAVDVMAVVITILLSVGRLKRSTTNAFTLAAGDSPDHVVQGMGNTGCQIPGGASDSLLSRLEFLVE